MKQGVG